MGESITEIQTLTRMLGMAGSAVEAGGVLIILVGYTAATARFVIHLRRRVEDAYEAYRRGLAKAIMLGLEFLIAGDIIRTVVATPTLAGVLVLGGIVLIRTFLSFSLELEIEGRLPWRRDARASRE